MSTRTWFSEQQWAAARAYFAEFGADDDASNSDSANNDAADARQAQLFDDKSHPDTDDDPTLILGDNQDYEQLRALRERLDKDDDA
jgi:TPR repeat protein